MAVPKDLFFVCSACNKPLIARYSEAGSPADCPHCFQQISVPAKEVQVIDKNRFEEPHGLRRILLEVRNEEWEKMRRKLQEARARIADLEKQLESASHKEALPEEEVHSDGSRQAGVRAELNRKARRTDGYGMPQSDLAVA